MTELNYEQFSLELRNQVPGFGRFYDEHVRDYDEVLPHVLLGELVRFLSDEVRAHGPRSSALAAAMALLERGMASEDPQLQELVAVSFLENLDREDESLSVIRSLMGPRLKEQIRTYEEAEVKKA